MKIYPSFELRSLLLELNSGGQRHGVHNDDRAKSFAVADKVPKGNGAEQQQWQQKFKAAQPKLRFVQVEQLHERNRTMRSQRQSPTQ